MVRGNEKKANYGAFRFFKSTDRACLLLSPLMAPAPPQSSFSTEVYTGQLCFQLTSFPFIKLFASSPGSLKSSLPATTPFFLGVELSSALPILRKMLTSLPFTLPQTREDLFTSEGSSELASLTSRSGHPAWPSPFPGISQLRSVTNRAQAPWTPRVEVLS